MTPWLKAGVFFACAYEVVSIWPARTPTISTLCGKHRWLPPLVLGGLAVHLYYHPKGAA